MYITIYIAAFFFILYVSIYCYINFINSSDQHYEYICNKRQKTVFVHKYENVIINEPFLRPILIKVTSYKTNDDFFNLLKDVQLNYSVSGTTKDTIGKTTHDDFLSEIEKKYKNYYIYHFTKNEPELIDSINSIIPPPKTYFINHKNMNIVIYSGGKHTGTYLHKHSSSINYLFRGKKLWIIFPNSEKNKSYLKNNKISYGTIKCSPLIWFNNNYKNLKQNIEHLFIFIQNSGEYVYIPNEYYHSVVNLETSHGIIYNTCCEVENCDCNTQN